MMRPCTALAAVLVVSAAFTASVRAQSRAAAGGGLGRAVIPTIEFRDAGIEEIIEILTEVSRTLDPAGKGINIIYVPDRRPQAARTQVQRTISVGLQNASLQDTIGTVCQILDLDWGVAHGAVWIGPRGALPENVRLQTREYYASPEVVSAILGNRNPTNQPAFENRRRLQRSIER